MPSLVYAKASIGEDLISVDSDIWNGRGILLEMVTQKFPLFRTKYKAPLSTRLSGATMTEWGYYVEGEASL